MCPAGFPKNRLGGSFRGRGGRFANNRSARFSDRSTSESQKQVIQLVCAESLETLIAQMKRSFDSVARLRTQLALTFAARFATRSLERGRTAERHVCHLTEMSRKPKALMVRWMTMLKCPQCGDIFTDPGNTGHCEYTCECGAILQWHLGESIGAAGRVPLMTETDPEPCPPSCDRRRPGALVPNSPAD